MKKAFRNLFLPGTYEDGRHFLLAAKQFVKKFKSDLLHRREFQQFRGKTGLKLNIGCGPLTFPGWVNIDTTVRAPGVFICDVRDPLPFDSGAVRHIHSEYFIGALSQENAQKFFQECCRVLQPGGSMRFVLSDLEKYARAYVSNDWAFLKPIVQLGGADPPLRTGVQFLNQTMRIDGFLYAYDFETLSLFLKEAGFQRVEKSMLGQAPKEFDIDGKDWWRPHEGLYVNAFKD